MLPIVILAAPFAVAVATCLFPIAGVLTLITTVIVYVIVQSQKLGGFMVIFVYLIPCWIVFYLGIRIEARAEESSGYRAGRYVYRLITGGLIAHAIALRITAPDSTTLPLLQRLSPMYVVLLSAGLGGIHLLSRTLDANAVGAQTVFSRLRMRQASR